MTTDATDLSVIRAYVDERGEVSISQVVGKFRMTPRAARLALEQLVRDDVVVPVDGGGEHGATRFRVPGRALVFGIWDSKATCVGDWYIGRFWDTQREAELELTSLLRPYPAGHEWRKRLSVKESAAAKAEAAPSGRGRVAPESDRGDWRAEPRMDRRVA